MNHQTFPATRFVDRVHGKASVAENRETRLSDPCPNADTYIASLQDKLILVSSSTHDFVGVLAGSLSAQDQGTVQPGFILSDAHRLAKRATALPTESEMAARALQRESLGFSKVWIPWSTVEAITGLNITPKQWRDCEA
jgi:hypothetical protein